MVLVADASYRHSDSDDESERRSDDFAMARILVSVLQISICFATLN